LSRLIVAIDGPAGAGKSTVAKRVARELGLNYLDTGAMYRALALKARRAGLGPNDGEAVGAMGEATQIAFSPGDPQKVFLDGEEVTAAIREPAIGDLASALSVHSSVRRVLVQRQKALLDEGGYTLEGRDVTTVVAPHAQVKIYMTASIGERARRRFLELKEKGMPAELAEIEAQIAERDHRDTTREDSPLRVADDAVVLDTDKLSVDEVVAEVKALAKAVSEPGP
jgi:cytidylate kinase